MFTSFIFPGQHLRRRRHGALVGPLGAETGAQRLDERGRLVGGVGGGGAAGGRVGLAGPLCAAPRVARVRLAERLVRSVQLAQECLAV